MVDLSQTVAGVRFKNPILVASATPSMNAELVARGIEAGAAGVIVKSLFGESGRLGRRYPRPRFKLYGYKDYPGYPGKLPRHFTLNSLEECSAFGYEEYVADIDRAKDLVGESGIVMASLSGAQLDEWETMVDLINHSRADWVELNVSCPFSADMGIKMGAGAVDMAPAITKRCAELLEKPFSVKVSPQAADPVAIARQVAEAGALAVNLSARLSGFNLDIETAAPMGWGSIGGWGGPYLLGYGLKFVSQAARTIDAPIIAGLGVWEWQDIVRYLMVGATLVQSAAGIMLQGFGAIEKWLGALTDWMEAKGYESLDDVRGKALPNILTTAMVVREPGDVFAAIDQEKCNHCGICVRSCFYDAIAVTRYAASVDLAHCSGCGMCQEVCPLDAASVAAV
jgi:dihydropyrimidine dehydrogenase (NAD+) subunit PreA